MSAAEARNDLCSSDLEEGRLTALYGYDILDTAPEESFDRITRLAKLTLQVPIAYVAFIDRDRQWLKSRDGMDVQQTERSASFCTYTIEEDQPLIVPDAKQDPRFSQSPLVTGEPFIRFYIGVPLRTPDGFKIGTLCAADMEPREVSAPQIAVLADLARLVVDELELRRLASTDSLTGVLTPRSFSAEAARNFARARREGKPLSAIMLDIDHFKAVNDGHGHAAGDQVIRSVAAACRAELRSSDILGRIGGEEFALLLPNCDIVGAAALAERLRARIAKQIPDAVNGPTVTASFGVTQVRQDDSDFAGVLARADAALYRAKGTGRNRVVVNFCDRMEVVSIAA